MTSAKSTKRKPDFDKIFMEKYRDHLKEYENWYKKYEARNVEKSILIEATKKQLDEIDEPIYKKWLDVDAVSVERNSDPFMAAMLDKLDELLKFNEDSPYSALIAKREEIEEVTRRLRWYGDGEPIYQTNEQLIDLIAKRQLLRDRVRLLNDEIDKPDWYSLQLGSKKKGPLHGKKNDSLQFEDLITGMVEAKKEKLKPFLDKYKNAKPKDLAILCSALNLDPPNANRTNLTRLVHTRFNVQFSRQAFSYQLDRCKDGSKTGRDILIGIIRKQIEKLTS